MLIFRRPKSAIAARYIPHYPTRMSQTTCPMCEMNDILDHPARYECATCGHEWDKAPEAETADGPRVVKDAHGNILADGDSVTLIKDLKVKGSGGVTLKRGTLVKNIRLTGDTDEIEANVDKVRGLVLRVEFVKKA